MKLKAYIYPITNRLKTGVSNPYLENFMNNTQDEILYLNRDFPSNTGILNIFRFLFKTDLVFLNWIENLPDKKGGIIQSVFLLILLKLRKLLGVKIIWTLHNKISHTSTNLYLKKVIFKSLLKSSDLIITHSKEGIRFAESVYPGVVSRIFYFPHPVVPVNGADKAKEDLYDILIWGSLAPYKGIDTFLEFLSKRNALSRYRILIAGKAVSPAFYKRIERYANEHIKIDNQFVDRGKLTEMIHQSKVVLFTYTGGSVLSSGALMDSISHRAMVIGPALGAFAEMGKMGIIRTYENFDELLEILEKPANGADSLIVERINNFVYSHTWQEFSKAFRKRLLLLSEGKYELLRAESEVNM